MADADVLRCIRMLTFLPLEEIDKMDSWEGAQLNTAKEILAYELTKLVHGEEEAKKAQESARALFSKGNAAEMPTTELTENDFAEGNIDILTMLVRAGLVPSKSEARRAGAAGRNFSRRRESDRYQNRIRERRLCGRRTDSEKRKEKLPQADFEITL